MRKSLPLVILSVLCFTAQAQEKKPSPTPKPLETNDVVRVSTELVQTDLTVFDKDGRFVSDCNASNLSCSSMVNPNQSLCWS